MHMSLGVDQNHRPLDSLELWSMSTIQEITQVQPYYMDGAY
jgi:hypothetical protein